MTQDTQQAKTLPWVKLHLAKQSDACAMPPFIVGKLQQELPTGYVLTNVLEPVEDERLVVGYRIEERKFFDTINRTYVWRCEILGGKPDYDELPTSEEYEGGGMG